MDAKEIVKALREHAEWAQANEWECPITLGDDLRKAADTIEELNDACYHPPYKGKWCAEIKDCPKEAAQAGEESR